MNFKNLIKRTSQDSIPFIDIDENTGIIECNNGKFSKSYRLQDINYSAARMEEQEQMFSKYLTLLRSFDSSTEVQITINNKNISQESLKRDILTKEKGDDWDKYRQQYNKILLDKLKEGKNNIVKEKYITISTHAEGLDEAIKKFSKIETSLSTNIKAISNSKVSEISAAERLDIIHNLYNKEQEGEFLTTTRINGKEVKSFDFKSLRSRGQSIKDVIAPNLIEFKSNYIRLGDTYARALYLSSIPSIVNDEFVNKITDVDFNTITSMSYIQMDKTKAVKLVKNQITNINSNLVEKQKGASKAGYDASLTNTDLQQAKEEAIELYKDITQRDQNIVLFTMVIVLFAKDKDELERETTHIINLAASENFQFKRLNTQQEIGFNTVLPLANSLLKIDRALTTESAGIFMPFNACELNQKNGAYYGLNQTSKNIIIFDRKTGFNYNAWVLGSSGSGKSFSTKREIFNTLLTKDADVIIIDPENEYADMCKMLKGTNITISTSAQNFINPLDVSLMYGDVDDDGKPVGDPINAKSEFILSLCSTVLGGTYGLSPVQNSIIDRCVHNIYREYQSSNYEDDSKIPTLVDLYNELMNQVQTDPSAYEVASALEMYATGSLNIFAHQTSKSLKVQSNFIVYNILGANGVLKTMSMLIILDNIWNRICYNRKIGRETYLYIDEAHLLLKNKETIDYLLSIFKRCRKYDGSITCITQNIGDIMRNEDTKAMLSNSSFIMLLNQSPLDIPLLTELLHISETQQGYINGAERGSGLLIINQNNIIPFQDKFPKNNDLFKVMTTTASDLKDIEDEEMLDKVQNVDHSKDID